MKHTTAPTPGLERAGKIRRERAVRAFGEAELEAALFEADEAHVPLESGLEHDVPMFAGQGDNVLEPAQAHG